MREVRMTRLAALCAAFAVYSFAADAPAPSKLPPLPRDIETIVAAARTAPPEIFADSIVSLVQGGRIPNIEWQKLLLQDAFAAAQLAHEPVRFIAVAGLSTDTRPSFRAKAGDLQLDALSLETRVLKALLTVDRALARQMFEGLPRDQPAASGCEDPLLPDASAYYEVAGAVAQSAFSVEEKHDSAHTQFLIAALAGANTPAELAGFIHTLAGVDLNRAEMEMVGGALQAKLDGIALNYRSFALKIDDLASGLDFFAARARGQRVSTDALGAAFRRFVVTQMQSPRCQEEYDQAAAFASSMWVKNLGDLAPLSKDEMKPSSRGGRFKAKSYFDDDRSKELAESLNRLRFSSEGRPFSEAQRSTGAWRVLFSDFLRDYQAWSPTGADIDILHQRLTVLRWLLELTPSGDDRNRVLRLSIAVLESGGAEKQSPAEWFWQAKSILSAAGADQRSVADAYRASGIAGLRAASGW
jgi:hypothetical protein